MGGGEASEREAREHGGGWWEREYRARPRTPHRVMGPRALPSTSSTEPPTTPCPGAAPPRPCASHLQRLAHGGDGHAPRHQAVRQQARRAAAHRHDQPGQEGGEAAGAQVEAQRLRAAACGQGCGVWGGEGGGVRS
mgnify:CR=1 FL=1